MTKIFFSQFNENEVRKIVDCLKFDSSGLINVIAQEHTTKIVLMSAYMNREALMQTLRTGDIIYYSRSRSCLWRKGETSGQKQTLVSIFTDCDKDCLLLDVVQTGVACHTGRHSCFSWVPNENGNWQSIYPIITDPNKLYGEA